ncbi:hypothetical protein GQR58_021329 [Nymphon striatum]|nr:hypothetical protein GQR58_021329 [Nymphon striatum]
MLVFRNSTSRVLNHHNWWFETPKVDAAELQPLLGRTIRVLRCGFLEKSTPESERSICISKRFPAEWLIFAMLSTLFVSNFTSFTNSSSEKETKLLSMNKTGTIPPHFNPESKSPPRLLNSSLGGNSSKAITIPEMIFVERHQEENASVLIEAQLGICGVIREFFRNLPERSLDTSLGSFNGCHQTFRAGRCLEKWVFRAMNLPQRCEGCTGTSDTLSAILLSSSHLLQSGMKYTLLKYFNNLLPTIFTPLMPQLQSMRGLVLPTNRSMVHSPSVFGMKLQKKKTLSLRVFDVVTTCILRCRYMYFTLSPRVFYVADTSISRCHHVYSTLPVRSVSRRHHVYPTLPVRVFHVVTTCILRCHHVYSTLPVRVFHVVTTCISRSHYVVSPISGIQNVVFLAYLLSVLEIKCPVQVRLELFTICGKFLHLIDMCVQIIKLGGQQIISELAWLTLHPFTCYKAIFFSFHKAVSADCFGPAVTPDQTWMNKGEKECQKRR